MALKIRAQLKPANLRRDVHRVFELSAPKILALERAWNPARGTPVFTVRGKYTSRGWTEWTQGFQFGCALLQFDATDEGRFLELGRQKTLHHMAPHVSHVGVHDHGFNNVSTYGNLRRLMLEGRIPFNERELDFYELALKLSGAIQASRWTALGPEAGYIYSFNGPHSLFVDTMRSLRALALGHALGHVLMGERDQKISLLRRLLQHAAATAKYNIYFGEGRDAYDVRGRTAHESVFNLNDKSYRCPNSQQGFSPFTTWTRGLAWAILGFAEQLEFFEAALAATPANDKKAVQSIIPMFVAAATATAEFFIENSCTDGVPLWDTGAPAIHRMGNYLAHPSDPYNKWEPVDSSAAAIAAQGFLRLGNVLSRRQRDSGQRYTQAGLTISQTLFNSPYLSTNLKHQGLLLHSVYHRPNGWDYISPGQKVPNGESSMWGDYHLLELALFILRTIEGSPYLSFFGAGDFGKGNIKHG